MDVAHAAREVLRDYGLAVVTGGSSGIGQCFIATVQEASPHVRIGNLSRSNPPAAIARHIPCDLADRAARAAAITQLVSWVSSEPSRGKCLLINNAGFGAYGSFPEPKTSRHLDMVEVNIAAVLDLTAALLPELRRRGGAIINVASTAAFQAIPAMATYAATKAFVLSWSLALREELGRRGPVRVQALCPGATETRFQQRASLGRRAREGGPKQAPAAVVAASFRGLACNRGIVVSGTLNRLAATLATHLPRGWVARTARRVVERNRLPRAAAS